MGLGLCVSTLVLAAGIVVSVLYSLPRLDLPPHLLGHTIHTVDGMLSEQEREEIMSVLVGIGSFPTNLADTDFYKAVREDVGEAIPYNGVQCAHPFLVPNRDRTLCVLPGVTM